MFPFSNIKIGTVKVYPNYDGTKKGEGVRMFEVCTDCLERQVATICKMSGMAEKTDEALGVTRKHLATYDIDQVMADGCEAMGHIWTELCREGALLPEDPYKGIRKTYNDLIAGYADQVHADVTASDKPVVTALKFAAGGNLIDFGANLGFDPSSLGELLETIPSMEFAIDDTAALMERLASAKTLTILSDNCGELLLDKVLLETLKTAYPELEITYMSREQPILNDTLPDEARAYGLDEFATLRGNGDHMHVPGTQLSILDEDARRIVLDSDVVIAKGMGNFESTYADNLPNEWFLFMNKCEHLRPWVDCEVKSLVCMGPERK
jgi:hypothetical protein